MHHHNELNSFNLADDLMEPFRLVIDRIVSKHIRPDDELNRERKQMLFNAYNLDILSGGQHHSVSYAIERMVKSLSASLTTEKASLVLPELIDITLHRYE